MAAVVGYLVAAGIAIALALFLAGPRHAGRRDPTFEIGAEATMVLVGFILLSVLELA